MTENVPRAVIRRQTHILVYRPNECDQHGFKALERELSVIEKDITGAAWVTFKALLFDVDPKGREVLRLPAETPEHLLRAAYPFHTFSVSEKPWPSRSIAIQFKIAEFPFKNSDQFRTYEYLANTGEFIEYPRWQSKLVVAGTAVGKSYCAIRAWVRRRDVLLGTFAQMSHLLSFKTELLKFTDLVDSEILVVDNGRSTLRNILKKPELIRSIKVVLVLHRTIWNCMNASITDNKVTDRNEFTNFVQTLEIGTHISDESHLEMFSGIYLALLINVGKTMYLTATPKRTDWKEDIVLGTHLPRERALVVAKKSRLAVIQVKYNTKPSDKLQQKSINRHGYFDMNFFFDYLFKYKWEMWEEMVVAIITDNFTKGAESVGIVVGGKLEFLDRVVERMKVAFPDKTVGNFSSRTPIGVKREAELHKDIVVTTEKSFNGSVNPTRMTHLLLCVPLSSPVYIEQISGRLRGEGDKPCILLDLWDSGFSSLIDQVKRRRTVLRKLCISLDEVEYHNSSGVTW